MNKKEKERLRKVMNKELNVSGTIEVRENNFGNLDISHHLEITNDLLDKLQQKIDRAKIEAHKKGYIDGQLDKLTKQK